MRYSNTNLVVGREESILDILDSRVSGVSSYVFHAAQTVCIHTSILIGL